MSNENSIVEYDFLFENGRSMHFSVDRERAEKLDDTDPGHAEWVLLKYHRCEDCPLDEAQWKYCPVAMDIEDIAGQFSDIFSYERAEVRVTTNERVYLKECDTQTALRSLLGLVMATSACPILSQLRGLALSHLPFATMEETLFRTVGAYLIKQYFNYKDGGNPDLELTGLDRFYQELQAVNRSLKERLDNAVEKEANLNAIGSLFYVSIGVTFSLDDNLRELAEMFKMPGPG
ncbi:MAG: hypothetical protein K9N48_00885 [Verrucomicrobia bacterium]|nr:hypothetical protein [Verrucomicrobiota bacterium]MCF7707859.1 hypothetical protein [Verrucomicrobiota bacterium]